MKRYFNVQFQRNETFQSAWYEDCIKSKHPNVFICPNKGIFNIPDNSTERASITKRNVEALRQGKIYKLELKN